jgi:hypothetical protein
MCFQGNESLLPLNARFPPVNYVSNGNGSRTKCFLLQTKASYPLYVARTKNQLCGEDTSTLSANETAVVRPPITRCSEDLDFIRMATPIHGVATITSPIPKISRKSSDTIDGAWSHQLVALVKCVLL